MRAIRISLMGMVLVMSALGAEASAATAFHHRTDHDQAVANAVEEFESAVRKRAGCVSEFRIEFAELPGRGGEYRSATSSVVIDDDVPVSKIRLVVMHELAHHAMISCELHNDPVFTSRFYTAGGLARGRLWFDYERGWAETPAELFAEAFTELVVGRSAHGEAVPAELVAVVAEWLGLTVEIEAGPIPPAARMVVGRRAVGMQPLLGSRRDRPSRPSRFGD